jgi:general stress protein YciG
MMVNRARPDLYEKEKIMPEKNQGGESGGRRSGRGFAGMDPERQRQIASEGGRAAHAQGTAHEFTPEEAREAGRKGGEASRAARARRASAEEGGSAEESGAGAAPRGAEGRGAEGGEGER